MKTQRFFTRCGIAVAALALTGLGAVPAASAAAAPHTAAARATAAPHAVPEVPPPNSTKPCVNDSRDFCRTAVPSHVGSGPDCQPFPNGMYWQNTTDAFDHLISWTYANGTTPCVRVTFSARSTPTVCTFWLYVPAGHATATFTLGWQDSSGNWHTTEPVNENSVYGWSEITMYNSSQRGAANVTQLYFQDNNGQSYPAELGWGSTNQYGIWQAC